MSADEGIAEILLPATRIRARVRALGRRIARDYAGRDLHLITVLRGGLFFLTDLARAIDVPLSLDTLAISSYSGGAQGSVRITKDLDDSSGYYLEFSYKLDVAQLPRPMQIGLQSGFALSIEQTRNFAADFSLK